MSNEEKNDSTSTDSKSSKTLYRRKNPSCGRCRVHGVKDIPLRDHKKYCGYRNCKCPHCYIFLIKQRTAADEIALRRAEQVARKKKKCSPQEVAPLPLIFADHKGYDLHNLLMYTWNEMHKSFAVWHNPTKIEHIFSILIKYACDVDARIKYDGFLESAKFCIYQAIHENQMPFMTTWRQEALEQACCYFQPWVVKTPNKEQLVEIRSPQCSFQNFPVWLPSNSLPISATNTSPFPENSFKPPTEAPTEPFIDPSPESSTEPSTEPPIDSATDLSTESSTYYCRDFNRSCGK